MFRNARRLAWRHLRKNRLFSILNIAELAVGLACALLLILWVYDERSFDRFHLTPHRLSLFPYS